MSQKTAAGLVAYAKEQLGKPYWYGTFGQKPTAELLEYKSQKQYPYSAKCQSYSPARMPLFRAQIGKFDRVHDCVGLVKGYLWSATNSSEPKRSSAQDVSADGMRAACKVHGPIGSMPDIPGLLLFLPGHVGVYVGGGLVIEARGSDYGVVQTKITGRGWTSWGQCPWIDYGENAVKVNEKFTIGDKVRIRQTGVRYYPTGAVIPDWVAGRIFTVQQVGAKNGVPCALLKEITSWCAEANLEKV